VFNLSDFSKARIINYMKRLFHFLLIGLIALPLPAQVSKAPKGYISTADKTTFGLVIIDQGKIKNSLSCKVDNGNKFTEYSPDEILEYRINEKQVYRSFPITGYNFEKRYFLERIIQSKVDIYILVQKGGVERYFLTEHNSFSLIEIPHEKEGYAALLGKYIKDCDKAVDMFEKLKINRNNLLRIFHRYEKCFKVDKVSSIVSEDKKIIVKPSPKIKYGLSLGGTESIISPVLLVDVVYPSKDDKIFSRSLSFGTSADIPILKGNFSLHPEIIFKKTGVSESYSSSTEDYNMVINYSSISLPVLLRYTILRKRISPYFEAGTLYSRAIKNKSQIYTYTYSGNNVYISSDNTHLLSSNLIGIKAGIGVISGYGSRYSWFADVCGCLFPTLNLRDQNHVNLSDISFGIGFLF
jgi:hypothetical protein